MCLAIETFFHTHAVCPKENEADLLQSRRMHVYVAKLRLEHTDIDVVVKRFKMCDEEAMRRFEAERKHLQQLSRESSNIICPLGVIVEAPTYALVLPWCNSYGSLDLVIHGTDRPSISDAWRKCLMRDCAAGVFAAHHRGVVLRDVKPANVLVGNDGIGRLADLELATTEEELRAPPPRHIGGPATKPRKRFEGTPEYVAPEMIKAYLLVPGPHAQMRSASLASDVYALGISLNQILTGTVPFSDVTRTDAQLHTVIETSYTPIALCQAVAEVGLRPTVTTHPLGCLVKRLWVQDRKLRPTAETTLEELDASFHPLAYMPEDRLTIGSFFETSFDNSNDAAPSASVLASAEEEQQTICKESVAVPVDALISLVHEVSPNSTRQRFLAGGGEGTAGRREAMEDAFAIVEWATSNAACYVVADGHGGSTCAAYVCKHLPDTIGSFCLRVGDRFKDVADAIRHAFLSVEAEWQALAAKQNDRSGACVVAALILGDKLWVAHCGDCRAVLDRGDILTLTTDHSVSNEMVNGHDRIGEAKRIRTSGGSFVTTSDRRHRVRSSGAYGGLQVTRSFGDGPNYPGVVADPEIVSMALTQADKTLVLASDGVWDVVGADQVMQRVRRTCRHKDFGAKSIVGQAFDSGSTDNICAVVIYMDGKGYGFETTVNHKAALS
eukprot:TRINITY_DN28529_c0_g1_i1.p1 TRINITY_DN28529_c0_g1~~TRINITY_DN28529_c0_g1_i1.p1  ORF type:complete len:668 (-),score=69.69 TRINITY_DN28529_c0_g1_i1:302-2305(-)